MKESFSVVIPVYNSHNTLPDLCSKLNETFFENDLEIILVDDGSRDNSWEQIKRLKAQYGSKLTGIRLSKNFGQQNATICGFDQATKEYLVTMDDDQQYLPESISMLHKTLVDGNFDIVYGLAIV